MDFNTNLMKKLFILQVFTLFTLGVFAGHPIEETMQEEVGLNLRKITDDNLSLGHIYTTRPYSFQSSIIGCSAKQKFYWTTFRRMDISPDGNELAYINISDKKGNVMIRKATVISAATQRTFRNVGSVSWGSDDKVYFADYTNGSNSKICENIFDDSGIFLDFDLPFGFDGGRPMSLHIFDNHF